MKPLTLALLFVALSGCVATQQVAPAGAGLQTLHEHLEGRSARIYFLDGRQTSGRIVRIRPDSTQWTMPDGELRTEATSTVHAFERMRRGGAAARGAAYGAAVGLPMALLAYVVTGANNLVFSSLGSEGGESPRVQALGVLVTLSLAGAALGAVIGQPQRWVINERTPHAKASGVAF